MLSRRLLRIKAVKALYSHFKSESDSLIVSEKNLMLSIDKTYELYLQMLWLVVEVANYAENRIELGRRKHLPTPEELNPNTKFVDNRVVAALRESNALTDYLQRKNLGWVQAPELVKKLYHAMVESDYYRKYMDAPARSFKEDVRLVESFYTRTVGESEALEEALEEQSILWADDADFAVIMVLILLFMFNSVKQSLTVWLTVPLAMIGVTCGLLLTGQPFGFMALLGFLSLSGMLIKNAIILIDEINTQLKNGKEPLPAVVDSSVSRMRPVAMAAFTTVLGMLPLIFDAFFAAMAVTIMFGLTFACVLTLIVVPVLYAMFYRIGKTS